MELTALKLAAAAAMVASLVAAVRLRAPERDVPGAQVGLVLAAAVTLHAAALLALLADRLVLAGVALVVAVEAGCWLTWLSRAGGEDGRDDDGPEGPGGDEPDGPEGPIDWGAFDRERASWSRRPRLRV